MSTELPGWRDEHLLDHRRRLRTAMFVSLAVHGLVLAAFAAAPPEPAPAALEYLAVDLVVAPPADAPPAPSPAESPSAPATAPAPAPVAEPAPPPEAAPPVAKAPVQVLPEETPGRVREAEPEPKVVAKVEPKPVAKPAPKPPPRPKKEKQVSMEDLLAEVGSDDVTDMLMKQRESQDQAEAQSEAAASAAARPGLTVSPEQAAWDREVMRKIGDRFPSFYRGQGLATQLQVTVSATGELAGQPKLLRTSGDLEFDRMTISIVERAAPLPPPPSPGVRTLNVTSQ